MDDRRACSANLSPALRIETRYYIIILRSSLNARSVFRKTLREINLVTCLPGHVPGSAGWSEQCHLVRHALYVLSPPAMAPCCSLLNRASVSFFKISLPFNGMLLFFIKISVFALFLPVFSLRYALGRLFDILTIVVSYSKILAIRKTANTHLPVFPGIR